MAEDVPRPAADAAVWMRWLAEKVTDPVLRTRLFNTASQAIEQVPFVPSGFIDLNKAD